MQSGDRCCLCDSLSSPGSVLQVDRHSLSLRPGPLIGRLSVPAWGFELSIASASGLAGGDSTLSAAPPSRPNPSSRTEETKISQDLPVTTRHALRDLGLDLAQQ